MTFLTPFLKINEYNKNTQSNIFNICIQEVIRGCVNWMETNLAMQSKTTKHSFLTIKKFGPEPVPVPFWQLSIDHNMDVHYQVKHRLYYALDN